MSTPSFNLHNALQNTSNTIAGAAIASPLWLQGISRVSEIASVALPILGCAWLLMQITVFLFHQLKGK